MYQPFIEEQRHNNLSVHGQKMESCKSASITCRYLYLLLLFTSSYSINLDKFKSFTGTKKNLLQIEEWTFYMDPGAECYTVNNIMFNI